MKRKIENQLVYKESLEEAQAAADKAALDFAEAKKMLPELSEKVAGLTRTCDLYHAALIEAARLNNDRLFEALYTAHAIAAEDLSRCKLDLSDLQDVIVDLEKKAEALWLYSSEKAATDRAAKIADEQFLAAHGTSPKKWSPTPNPRLRKESPVAVIINPVEKPAEVPTDPDEDFDGWHVVGENLECMVDYDNHQLYFRARLDYVGEVSKTGKSYKLAGSAHSDDLVGGGSSMVGRVSLWRRK